MAEARGGGGGGAAGAWVDDRWAGSHSVTERHCVTRNTFYSHRPLQARMDGRAVLPGLPVPTDGL